jgi:hypothetical protein
MKNQVNIYFYISTSFIIFSLFVFISYLWITTTSNIQKISQKELLEYFKETLESSIIFQISVCKFCISNLTLRTSTMLPTRSQEAIIVLDSFKYFYSDYNISSSFYNFTSFYSIDAIAETRKNIYINLNNIEKYISIKS